MRRRRRPRMGAGSKIPPGHRGGRSAAGAWASIVRRRAKATALRARKTARPCNPFGRERAPARTRFAFANPSRSGGSIDETGRDRHSPFGWGSPPRPVAENRGVASRGRTKAAPGVEPGRTDSRRKAGSALRTIRRGGVLAAAAKRQDVPSGRTGERARTGGCGSYRRREPCQGFRRGEHPGSPGRRPARSNRPFVRVRWLAAVRSRPKPYASRVPGAWRAREVVMERGFGGPEGAGRAIGRKLLPGQARFGAGTRGTGVAPLPRRAAGLPRGTAEPARDRGAACRSGKATRRGMAPTARAFPRPTSEPPAGTGRRTDRTIPGDPRGSRTNTPPRRTNGRMLARAEVLPSRGLLHLPGLRTRTLCAEGPFRRAACTPSGQTGGRLPAPRVRQRLNACIAAATPRP